jgi:arsenical pump membrane protein
LRQLGLRPRKLLPVAAAPLVGGAALACLLDPRARDAASQADGPFLLVAGLLVLGLVADADGVFDAAATSLRSVSGSPRRMLALSLALVAVVTAILNLDTAVVFLTPVLIGAARGAGVVEEPFLYGSVLMANASSLLLPGANLTNLLVLEQEPVSGATFVARMWPAAVAAAVVTAAGLLAWHWRDLGGAHQRPDPGPRRAVQPLGLVACVIAAGLVLALPNPGLPVLLFALAVAGIRVAGGRLRRGQVIEALGPVALASLFSLSVVLGLVARTWSGPADLLGEAGVLVTTAIGALAAVTVNNLPGATLLAATPPVHPRALLLGLNLGPNLAVTGSLSAYLWWRAARNAGARPSVARFSRVGVVLAPAAMAAGLAAIALAGRT